MPYLPTKHHRNIKESAAAIEQQSGMLSEAAQDETTQQMRARVALIRQSLEMIEVDLGMIEMEAQS